MLDHWQSTAKSTMIFTMLLAPALLHGRFRSCQYYNHFLKLIQLINIHSPDHLRVCTLPIHSLLHITNDIEAMGPVWCYWAFPMERFCGALVHTNLNPHFPFASLDRHVLEVAQLVQIKLTYNLFDTLNLGDCKHTLAKGTHYPEYPDSIFVRLHCSVIANNSLAKQIGSHLSALHDTDAKEIEGHVKGQELDVWGKMQQTMEEEGLDMINGYLLMLDMETPCWDATYVKVHFSYSPTSNQVSN
ncbi:hypothetical protein FRC11_006882 [Ceratobasidium sp. 423]|nr:hypothetical protein FRC11_006882 [Ceratobasidium sp. 423]